MLFAVYIAEFIDSPFNNSSVTLSNQNSAPATLLLKPIATLAPLLRTAWIRVAVAESAEWHESIAIKSTLFRLLFAAFLIRLVYHIFDVFERL